MTNIFGSNSLFEHLKIQYRVIRALMLRQIILRWGRNNLGYFWLFVEPVIFILVVVGFLSLVSGKGIERSHFQIPVIPFLFLGFSQSMTWRFVSNKCAGAFSGNIPLLEHRSIRPLDLFVSTALVEILGVSAAFVGIYVVFMLFGLMEMPKSLPMLIYAWFLLIWFSLFFGVLFGALSGAFNIIEFAMRGVTVGLYILSGVVFSVDWVPPDYRNQILWVPMIHGTEMMRHAYFGDSIVTYENVPYFVSFNVVLTFSALLVARASWLEDIRE